MTTLDQKLRLHPDVVDTRLEDEIVLLHLKSKLYFSLNLTGGRIWQGIKEDLSLKEISARLQTEFAVEAEQATAAYLLLLTSCRNSSLWKCWFRKSRCACRR